LHQIGEGAVQGHKFYIIDVSILRPGVVIMSIGPWQIILILVIVLIIFGAGKLPRVAGDLAKGIKNFKSGMSEDDKEADDKKEISSEASAKEKADDKDKAAQS